MYFYLFIVIPYSICLFVPGVSMVLNLSCLQHTLRHFEILSSCMHVHTDKAAESLQLNRKNSHLPL